MGQTSRICFARRRTTWTGYSRDDTRRPADPATSGLQASRQHENREGARAHDRAVVPGAGGSGDRVVDRRAFVRTSMLSLLAAPQPPRRSRGESPDRLSSHSIQYAASTRFTPFFQGLRDLGYVDGRNIAIDYLSVDGQAERFPTLAADCVRLKADVIVVPSYSGRSCREERHPHDPDRLHALGDPVATGLLASLARPGGNVTGVTQCRPGLPPSVSSC